MNDRYLFRAKRIDNGEWVEGFLFQLCYDSIFCWCIGNEPLSPNDYSELCGFNREWFYIDESTICQCTGLKDKNGKLIWENDILDGHIKRGAAFYRCIVLWNECNARFDVRSMECNFPMTLDECIDDISISGFDYEAIGNVFDNPDMVEEE